MVFTMKTVSVFHVEGMSCSHCVAAVTNAAKGLPGVVSVAVDLGKKEARVEYDDAAVTPEKIRAAIEDQGYDVVG